jgi:pantoate--beta-alanine ligase
MTKPQPAIWETISVTRDSVKLARDSGKRIGFVPTMGALHEGHASLVRAARAQTDFVVVSIFVNPTQFGPKEDFAKYPRTLDADRELCRLAGADGLFVPNVAEMYPALSVTFVEVLELDQVLCGPSRPGHFRGVCTVVAKLFQIVQADLAFFGQKDAQQCRIIKQMVRDLNIPVQIQIEPTVREADGLAMSSRNRYLSDEERKQAPRIYQALQQVRQRVLAGECDVARLESALQAELASIPGARLDYARILDDESLQKISRIERPVLVAVALFLGSTRLIDNITLP